MGNLSSFCQLHNIIFVYVHLQLVLRTAMLTLVLVLVPSSWMMSGAAQVLASCWSAPVGQSYPTTASILMMLVLDVKVG